MSRPAVGALAVTGILVSVCVTAPAASAVNVYAQGEFRGTAGVVRIERADPTESNRITVTPAGAVRNDTGDPLFTLLPRSLVVRDAATALGDVSGSCERLSAHAARCTWPQGIDWVDAFLGSGNDSFRSRLGRSGARTPIGYGITTGDGTDTVRIPVSKGASIFTEGGNDVIAVGQQSYFEGITVYAGAGDDKVRAVNAGPGSVDCGDGNDQAVIVSALTGNTNCETATPGP